MHYFKLVKTVVFILLCLISVIVIIAAAQNRLPVKILVVKSGSMEPEIKTGSLIFVAVQKEYHKKEVVSFLNPRGMLITHRLVTEKEIKNKTFFQTKGDRNNAPDLELVSSSQIVGKLFWAIPYLGFVISFAQTPLGATILIVIPATIIIYEEIKKIIFKIGSKKNEKNS